MGFVPHELKDDILLLNIGQKLDDTTRQLHRLQLWEERLIRWSRFGFAAISAVTVGLVVGLLWAGLAAPRYGPTIVLLSIVAAISGLLSILYSERALSSLDSRRCHLVRRLTLLSMAHHERRETADCYPLVSKAFRLPVGSGSGGRDSDEGRG